MADIAQDENQKLLQPNEITSFNLKWDRYANQYRGGVWWAAKDYPHHPREALATATIEKGMWTVSVIYNGAVFVGRSLGNPAEAMGKAINTILGPKEPEIQIDINGGIAP